MKGIVFTEFLDMVEREFGEALMEDIIDNANLASGGAYTSVGSYPAEEMTALVRQLSMKTQLPNEALLEKFGFALFQGLHRSYPHFFTEGELFDFLASIHTHIHVEVKKLYTDAELPNLHVVERTSHKMVLLYESPRKMGDLARGLLKASINFFEGEILLTEELAEADGSKVKFTLEKA